MLSNNVKTRDMLFGTYLGKLPVFGLAVFFLSPILISPFVRAYEVSIIGQLLMYSVMVIFAFVNIWLSNIIVTIIQAKIGGSSRGEDLGRALSWAIIPIIAVPAFGVMYFAEQVSVLMGTDIFILLPSTWCADLVTWIAIHFNGINMPASSIMNLEYILHFGPAIDFLLVATFSFVVLVGGIYSSGRLFSIRAGAGPSRVAKAGKENIFLRGIRRISPRRFGVLIVTSLKDYGRKLQNVSKLGYATFLSILMPLIMKYSALGAVVDDPLFLPIMSTYMLGLMLGVFAGIAFGGLGLLDSKDQLWILKSTPRGTIKFVGARIISYFLLTIPYVIIPSLITWIIMGLTFSDLLLMLFFAFATVYGAIMVGLGITAINPTYDNQTSTSFALNTAATVVTLFITLIGSLVWGIISSIEGGIFSLVIMNASIPVPVVGIIIVIIGTLRLSLSENA